MSEMVRSVVEVVQRSKLTRRMASPRMAPVEVARMVADRSGVPLEDFVRTKLRGNAVSRARAVLYALLRACYGMTHPEATRAVMGSPNHNVSAKGCRRIVQALAAEKPKPKQVRDIELWRACVAQMELAGWPASMTRLETEPNGSTE